MESPTHPVAELTETGLHVVVTSTASDSHTWNLVYLQLMLEELGHRVTNLGACVPDEMAADRCSELRPDLIVVSSVNGHGCNDGLRLIDRLRSRDELRATPVVIGGKLGVAGADAGHGERLLAAGFDAVFDDNGGIAVFRSFLNALPVGVTR